MIGFAPHLVLAFAIANPTNPFDAYVPLLGVGDRVTDAPFIDQRGKDVRLTGFRGETVVVGFIYTNCIDECPLISEKFGQLERELAGTRFHLIEVSIDPARDTPAVVMRYAKRFRADPERWSIVTTSPSGREALYWFERALGESVIIDATGKVIHNNRTVIVAPDGTIADLIDEASWTPSEVAAQARAAGGQPANPLLRADLALGRAVAFVCGGFQSGHAGILDVLGTIAILGAFGLALYLVGRKFFAMPS